MKAKNVGTAAVGELIWSELMGDEQMYGVWGMFELLTSIFRANLRDLDVNLRGICGNLRCQKQPINRLLLEYLLSTR